VNVSRDEIFAFFRENEREVHFRSNALDPENNGDSIIQAHAGGQSASYGVVLSV
jgi:hypothetical protein